jgi:hypothetical protein
VADEYDIRVVSFGDKRPPVVALIRPLLKLRSKAALAAASAGVPVVIDEDFGRWRAESLDTNRDSFRQPPGVN